MINITIMHAQGILMMRHDSETITARFCGVVTSTLVNNDQYKYLRGSYKYVFDWWFQPSKKDPQIPPARDAGVSCKICWSYSAFWDRSMTTSIQRVFNTYYDNINRSSNYGYRVKIIKIALKKDFMVLTKNSRSF